MALGVDTVYKEFLNQVNKNQNSGYINGDEYTRLAQRVNLDWYNDQYKEYESSIKNSDDLQLLKTTVGVPLVSGVATLPTDYYHYDKVTHTYYPSQTTTQKRTIEPKTTSQDDFGFFEPSLKYSTFEIFGGNIKVYPSTIQYITLYYLSIQQHQYGGTQ